MIPSEELARLAVLYKIGLPTTSIHSAPDGSNAGGNTSMFSLNFTGAMERGSR